MVKKSILKAGLGLAAFCLATQAMAYDDDYYSSGGYYSYSQAPVPVAVPSRYGPVSSGFVIGIGGGYANTHWDNIEIPGLTSISSGGFTGQGFLGFDFNRFFGLEAGYVYLPTAEDNVNLNASNYVVDLLAKLSLPVTSGFSVYALAGGSYLHSSLDVGFGTLGIPNGTQDDRSHFGPAFGVGAQYEIIPNLAIGVDWRRYSGQGKISTDDYQPSPDAVFLNVSYKFPINIS